MGRGSTLAAELGVCDESLAAGNLADVLAADVQRVDAVLADAR
jgi:hypothetical protein